jgi:uncharacterized protein (TIGR00255 family)
MMKSMTAYARAEISDDTVTASVEIRSYNSRFLDVVLRVPSSCTVLEEKIKSRVKEAVTRGRIEVNLQVDEHSGDAIAFQVDEPKAAAYYQALSHLKQILKIDLPVTIEQIIGFKDVIIPVQPEDDTTLIWPQIERCLDRALSDLDGMRQTEGENIARDIEQRIDAISQHLIKIKETSSGLLEVYRTRLGERIASLTHGVVEIDAGRVAQEAAILAERSDITEEIVRAASHVDQFRSIMNDAEAAGRKLNFLLQELNREFNTIGAKTDKSGVAHMVVDVKAELEKIREQVQNVE